MFSLNFVHFREIQYIDHLVENWSFSTSCVIVPDNRYIKEVLRTLSKEIRKLKRY